MEKADEAKKMGKLTNEEKKANDRILWSEWVHKYKESLFKMDASITDEMRKASMNRVNPKFVLRNYIMEEAIKMAENNDDFSKVNELLELAFDPYNEKNTISEAKVLPPPRWAYDLCVSCSS